ALLEDRVALVPQREPEAQVKVLVAEAADAVFAPAIGAAARVIMREICPGVAVGAVILAHRAPLALADIGSPAPPGRTAPRFLQPAAFSRLRDVAGGVVAAVWRHSRLAGVAVARQLPDLTTSCIGNRAPLANAGQARGRGCAVDAEHVAPHVVPVRS